MSENILVDANSALGRLGGRMEMYKRLLKKYYDADYIAPIEEKIAQGDTAGAVNAAHAIKGVAANLSLIALSSAAHNLEQALINGEDHTGYKQAILSVTEQTREEVAKLLNQ
ncbi:MAG: Hpt domain-containing protein [Defluviitaleaceae bacterium]|nr:Hpt domain-containing protein [Defluviitaleaceae bacterium]